LVAYYHHGPTHVDITKQAIEQAIEVGLPPILLTPLYWLEEDAPDVFAQYAKSLLQKHEI
ncbi:MAG TPA: hypothetical protein VKR06_35965, partial [Ktedonosporobacter sp.]|nr:hypothetical protein [Ktedonosporobacter sp.]